MWVSVGRCRYRWWVLPPLPGYRRRCSGYWRQIFLKMCLITAARAGWAGLGGCSGRDKPISPIVQGSWAPGLGWAGLGWRGRAEAGARCGAHCTGSPLPAPSQSCPPRQPRRAVCPPPHQHRPGSREPITEQLQPDHLNLASASPPQISPPHSASPAVITSDTRRRRLSIVCPHPRQQTRHRSHVTRDT